MVDAQPEWIEEFQFDTFWTRLMEEALGTGSFQWDEYDMVSYSIIMYLMFSRNGHNIMSCNAPFVVQFFFPVWVTTHQYVVCFDLPDCKMNIIDHSLAETHGSFGDKYGNTPSVLVFNMELHPLCIIYDKLYIICNC